MIELIQMEWKTGQTTGLELMMKNCKISLRGHWVHTVIIIKKIDAFAYMHCVIILIILS